LTRFSGFIILCAGAAIGRYIEAQKANASGKTRAVVFVFETGVYFEKEYISLIADIIESYESHSFYFNGGSIIVI
jgi:hypothetical protein